MPSMQGSPPTPLWVVLVRILGQSLVVMWSGFWLITMIYGVFGGSRLQAACTEVVGCRLGFTTVGAVGLLLGLAVLVICRLTGSRTVRHAGWHTSAPWIGLVFAAALTVAAVKVLMT
ncbi:MAG: hypothetical protein WAX29_02855 [Propionibacterium sp.]